ncbi:hypothetical protein NIES4071_71640 [Calothrix sp. NIES-4071]|nr:hypothetical protein NIES4071_71640 [Calothrix sp. NIES-4071]BAZ61439.1 hypothetical protein NIES4105_71590 [Calothrix sp. NIES-4105]
MLDSETIVRPVYYRIIERRGKIWAFKEGQPFVNWFNAPNLEMEDLFSLFDTSMEDISAELRRHFGGQQGYYIANILDKKYYYCGTEWNDVKTKFRELGIGRPDPMSK